jgi:hypothetical protein
MMSDGLEGRTSILYERSRKDIPKLFGDICKEDKNDGIQVQYEKIEREIKRIEATRYWYASQLGVWL